MQLFLHALDIASASKILISDAHGLVSFVAVIAQAHVSFPHVFQGCITGIGGSGRIT